MILGREGKGKGRNIYWITGHSQDTKLLKACSGFSCSSQTLGGETALQLSLTPQHPGLKVRPHICPHQSTSQQRTKLQPGKSPQCFLCKTSVGTRTAGKIAATDEKKRYMQPFALNTETIIHFHFLALSGFDYRRKNRLRLLPILHNYANIGR